MSRLFLKFFSNFFWKRLDKPIEMVYTKVTLIENETLVSICGLNKTFLTLSKAQLPAKVKTYSPK